VMCKPSLSILFLVGLVLFLFPCHSQSKFLSSFEIKTRDDGYSTAIYWNAKLHVVSSRYGPHIVRYDSKGNKEAEWTLPGVFITHYENLFLVNPESRNPVLTMTIEVGKDKSRLAFDLGAWNLKLRTNIDLGYLIPIVDSGDLSWSTAMLMTGQGRSEYPVSLFDLNSFRKTESNFKTIHIPATFPWSALGLLRNKTIAASVKFERGMRLALLDLTTGEYRAQDYIHDLVYFMGGANPLAPARQPLLGFIGSTYFGSTLLVTSIDNPYSIRSHVNVNGTGVEVDGANAFVFGPEVVYQYSYNNNDQRLVLLDIIKVPSEIKISHRSLVDAVTYAASFQLQQVAIPTMSGFWVINYDGGVGN